MLLLIGLESNNVMKGYYLNIQPEQLNYYNTIIEMLASIIYYKLSRTAASYYTKAKDIQELSVFQLAH